MTYLAHVNRCIRDAIGARKTFVSFGQNIAAGSHLSGLTRNLPRDGERRVINMPNCENAMAGFGFGLMMQGVDSAFFCKQLDFLLLACDQMVNTYNMARLRRPAASFTIVCIVVDSGFEGPQSRLNTLADFGSMADIDVFSIASGPDAEAVFARHLVSPGFRIIAVSQRLFPTEVGPASGDFADVSASGDARILRHASGGDATIVAFNFALPQASALWQELQDRGTRASLYSVTGLPAGDWAPVLADAKRTGRLILADDSRTRSRAADGLRAAVTGAGIVCEVIPLYRAVREDDIRPHADRFVIDSEAVRRSLGAASVSRV